MKLLEWWSQNPVLGIFLVITIAGVVEHVADAFRKKNK